MTPIDEDAELLFTGKPREVRLAQYLYNASYERVQGRASGGQGARQRGCGCSRVLGWPKEKKAREMQGKPKGPHFLGPDTATSYGEGSANLQPNPLS